MEKQTVRPAHIRRRHILARLLLSAAAVVILLPVIQLAEHIVQQHYRILPHGVFVYLALRQLQAQCRRPYLPLRAELPRAAPVYQHLDIVLVGAGETQLRRTLRRLMALHMCRQRRVDICLASQRVGDGPDGLVRQGQLLPLAAALIVCLPGIFRQRRTEPRPIAYQHCAAAAQAFVEFRQQVQKLWLVLAVPQDAGLVLVAAVIL